MGGRGGRKIGEGEGAKKNLGCGVRALMLRSFL